MLQAVVVPVEQLEEVPVESRQPARFRVWWVFDLACEACQGRVFMEVADRQRAALRLTRIEVAADGMAWPGEMQQVLEDRTRYSQACGILPEAFKEGTFPEETVAEAVEAIRLQFICAFEWQSNVLPSTEDRIVR